LYLYNNAGRLHFQDGIFHKKNGQISGKMRIDISVMSVVY
jgi:hypothetical protein